jgi:hypothetical protein
MTQRAAASVVEIVVVVSIAAFALGQIVSAFTASTRATEWDNRRYMAMCLTNGCMERYRALPFATLKTLFGEASGGGREQLAADAVLRNDLVGQAFEESISEATLEGSFTEQVPGTLGVLTFTCRFVTRSGHVSSSVTLSQVVVDYARVGWGKLLDEGRS